MRLAIIAFVTGILLANYLPILPPGSILLWVFFVAIVMACFHKSLRVPACLLLGSCWSMLQIQGILQPHLPEIVAAQNRWVTGVVLTVPQVSADRTSFILYIDACVEDAKDCPTPLRVKVNWFYPTQNVYYGERWQLLLHLKPIHGMANSGGFDYERWAMMNGVQAQASVISKANNHVLQAHARRNFFMDFRQYFRNTLLNLFPQHPLNGIVLALTIGLTDDISKTQWQVFQRTGTSHLVAISGLHIGMVGSSLFLLFGYTWRRVPNLCYVCPAQLAAAVATIVAVSLYSFLSGFSVPTQRSFSMIVVGMLLLLCRGYLTASVIYCLALLFVVLLDAFATLRIGFWLSFVAVFYILLSHRMNRARQSLTLRMQWYVFWGMLPWCIWFFQQASLISPLANVIAIPWVGLLVVPLCLLGCILSMLAPALAKPFLWCALQALQWLWAYLAWLAQFSWATKHYAFPTLTVFISAVIGITLLLLPRMIPARALSLCYLLPSLLVSASPLARGAIDFTLLDVGQGLAVVVRTRQHVLLYDTGPRYSEHLDAGNAVIVPFLQAQALHRIDMLMLSHGDSDHSGGVQSILLLMPVAQLISSEPQKLSPLAVQQCLAPDHWQWDGVNFDVLHPEASHLNLKNNSSCVLRISNEHFSILLTGDIEKRAEKLLIATQSQHLASTILVAPHHGSRTSSSRHFIELIHPQYVLFASGYRNRYRFPNQWVRLRYQQLSVPMLNTALSGAIHFVLTDQLLGPDLFRQQHHYFWQHSPAAAQYYLSLH